MKNRLAINNFEAWSMELGSEWFHLNQGEYNSIEISKDEIDDLIELLHRVKGNYSPNLNNTTEKIE